MVMNERKRSRIIYVSVLMASLMSMRCATKKSSDEVKEPVAAAPSAAADENLPPELREAHKFDPAAELDAKGTDFDEVRKNVQANASAIDAEWKAQEQLEDSVRKSKEDEELRKKEEQKKEEAEREQARLEATKNYKANAARRAREEREAREEVKKMPTISKEEVMWNGLED